MATAIESDLYVKELKELQGLLAKGPKYIGDLPKSLQEPEFIGYCLENGRVQIGRFDYSHERKPGTSEAHEARPMIVKVSKNINWTSLGESWHQTIYELLAEDEKLAKLDQALRLQVKLSRRAA